MEAFASVAAIVLVCGLLSAVVFVNVILTPVVRRRQELQDNAAIVSARFASVGDFYTAEALMLYAIGDYAELMHLVNGDTYAMQHVERLAAGEQIGPLRRPKVV